MLSKATFTVFLLHTFFFRFFDIQRLYTLNIFVMVVLMLFIAFLIYFICFIVDLIYKNTVVQLFGKLESKYPLIFEVK